MMIRVIAYAGNTLIFTLNQPKSSLRFHLVQKKLSTVTIYIQYGSTDIVVVKKVN